MSPHDPSPISALCERQSPALTLSAAGRTGGTLLERLLISTWQVMIGGEHDGTLLAAPGLPALARRLGDEIAGGETRPADA